MGFERKKKTRGNIGSIVKQAGSAGKASQQQGVSLSTKVVPIEEVYPDKEQARKLPFTLEELLAGKSDNPKAQREINDIIALADDIRINGLTQLPIAFLDGARYQLIDGNRRYWALRYNKTASVTLNFHKSRPKNLRAMQFTANDKAKSLPLDQRLMALQMAVDEAKENGSMFKNSTDLAAISPDSESNLRRYWSLLNAPDDVRKAIDNLELTGLALAAKVANEKDPAKRKDMIAHGDAISPTKPVQPKPAVKRGKGRPAQYKFGATTSTAVATHVIEKLAPDMAGEFDLSDPKAVSKAFVALIKRLEEELA